ncbi:hypothetical protein J1605_022971 [Eschrichtius robustus]|uniref:Uncharacterized protein n=1 Tax=Eschrichtius robustus TaxID=9764 RepID=A0AB34H724_ESCRO|nr:hypothetical protein J1605_022971 [Eschrichtius robustus]
MQLGIPQPRSFDTVVLSTAENQALRSLRCRAFGAEYLRSHEAFILSSEDTKPPNSPDFKWATPQHDQEATTEFLFPNVSSLDTCLTLERGKDSPRYAWGCISHRL